MSEQVAGQMSERHAMQSEHCEQHEALVDVGAMSIPQPRRNQQGESRGTQGAGTNPAALSAGDAPGGGGNIRVTSRLRS